MAKKLVLVVFCLGILFNLEAQEKKTPIIVQKKVIGYDFLHGEEVKGEKYSFTRKVYKADVDTALNTLILQLRDTSKNGKWYKNTGSILVYNFKDEQMSWEKKIEYGMENLEKHKDLLYYTSPQGSRVYSIPSGIEFWYSKPFLYHIDKGGAVGLGLERNSNGRWKDRIWGINLNSGEKIWERKIEFDYGWDNVVDVNDSTLLVVAGGLHSVNLNDGTGWDYNVETGVKDYSNTTVKNVIGITTLLLAGAGSISTGYDLLGGLVSNVLIDDTGYYLASKNEIAHLNTNGEILWKTPFPQGMSSKSSIFIHGNLLYMVNYGTANVRNQECKYGTSFWACYDKTNGEQKVFNLYMEEGISSFLIRDETIYLQFPSGLMKYSLKDNSLLAERKFSMEQGDGWKSFVTPRMFYENDSIFESVELPDTDHLYLHTASSGELNVVSTDLEIINRWAFDDLYFRYMTYNGYHFLGKKGKTIIIDQTGKMVAELQVTNNALLMGNKLYDVSKNYFIEVDLNFLNR